MDKILMKDMRFYGYHGVFDTEKLCGQNFIIDAELYLPLKKAGMQDDLSLTVNYAEVYKTIKIIAENEQFNLMECLAERICAEVFLTQPMVQSLHIIIKKPDAPVDGKFDYFGVEIERTRESYE